MSKSKSKSNSDPTKVITPECRLSYPYLFRTKTDKKGNEKYQAEIVFPPGCDLTPLRDAISAAIDEKWGNKPPNTLRLPLRKGDDNREYGEDHMFCGCNSTNKPGILVIEGGQKVACTEPMDVYPGCYGRVDLKASAYDFEGNKGVKFFLNNFLKTRDGDRLDGFRSADDAFADVDAAAYGGGGDDTPYM